MSLLSQVTKVPVKVQVIEVEIAPVFWLGAACLFAGIVVMVWLLLRKLRNRKDSGDQLDD
jgi:hypothetical protein